MSALGSEKKGLLLSGWPDGLKGRKGLAMPTSGTLTVLQANLHFLLTLFLPFKKLCSFQECISLSCYTQCVRTREDIRKEV